ncbi:helix-turn-helix domain-containing protein [Haloarchaeobius sp. HME9146]|uniref:helix-turn-helix domain-containing protein n=1 Tax=Haloarchaeobius sp. HME9146 TaxID=2978732 RepID=UPI0021BFDA48|nr:helix-turn-helix domain-containing protein [Haloarchaeobius sp. HME9146]MCT9097325.1 helix-turn-helix domain-containing protein [Haloarchaeobius sp. HME9146]
MKSVGLRLRPAEGAFPGVDEALAGIPGVTREGIQHLEWLADGTYAMLYRVSGGDEVAIGEVLTAHDEVLQHDMVSAGADQYYVFVNVAEQESVSALLQILDEHRLLLDPPLRVTDDGLCVTVAGDGDALQAAFADVTDVEVPIEVEWTGGYRPGEPAALSRLTDRQREALEAAHSLGFYETPREASFEDIGEALSCSPSTANELLRRAEARVVSSLLDG